ncbi:E2/UBC family protein E [Kribbella sp. VKM Ac-2571]|uniref:E2/UBC family protein n=1 Tax=Kribbella sp. VKM Ac-2571 TaxID=2512222 RepID=UPI00105B49E0|nr:E2/UBC family protein [Kribbella sp. VKM Ac-2571]TDO68416.1 E2/UBC family protein E [Kribbella sp. VKM Ac-2571]
MARDHDTAARVSRLQAEATLIAQRFGPTRFDRQDGTWLYIEKFTLPRGWNKSTVDILIDVPSATPGYPSVAPQWFWVDHDLRTDDGRPIGHFFEAGPQGNGEYADKGWGHFCIHIDGWRPADAFSLGRGHTLLSYANLILAAFHDHKRLRQ